MRSLQLVAAMGALFAVLAGPAAPTAEGQVAWDSPMLLAPGSPGGLGLLLVDPGGGGVGVMGTWRRSAAPAGIGLRLLLAEDVSDDLAVGVGLDLSGTLLRATEEMPVGFMWLLGAGIGAGDEVLISFPAGISAGIDLETDGVLFRPYVTPRVSLDVRSGPGDDLDLAAAVDIGLDLAFTSSWLIRFGVSLGDRDGLAVGLAFPGASFD